MQATIKLKANHYSASMQFFLIIWTSYSVYSMFSGVFSYSYQSYENEFSTLSLIVSLITILLLSGLSLFNVLSLPIWGRSSFICFAAFLIVLCLVQIQITDRNLMIIFLFILAAHAIDFDQFLRYDFKLKIFMLFSILLMCALGILINRAEVINGSYKMALGFAHPNSLACYALIILIEWFCIRYGKMRLYDWIGLLISTVLIWMITKSRSSIYTFVIIFILYIIANYNNKLFEIKIVQGIIISVPVIITFLSFYVIYLYAKGNSIAIKLDSILTGRIRLGFEALSQMGVKLFGQEITFSSIYDPHVTGVNFTVDNAYVHMALRWGLIITCIIIVLYTIQINKLLQLKRYDLLLASLFAIGLGFGENYMTNIIYNLSLMLLFGLPKAFKLPPMKEGNKSFSPCKQVELEMQFNGN